MTNYQPDSKLVRFGQINFINCLPVTLPIESGYVQIPAHFIYGNPAQLNTYFKDGSLDLSAMSSFFYLQNKNLRLIPTLTISSDGPCGSVLFFSKTELKALHGAQVSATAKSATSFNLLKVLLKEKFGVIPNFIIESEPDISSEDNKGALVIGDQALICDPDWSKQYLRIDLGTWWNEFTGLPMVFGVWAAHGDWYQNNIPKFEMISKKLKEALDLGLGSSYLEVEKMAMQKTKLSAERVKQYFHQELNFNFTDRHEQGLALYEQLCAYHKFIS